MKISTQLRYEGDIVQASRDVTALERAGLDLIWVPEAYGFDAPSFMGAIAARTDRVEIGSGILSVYTRTPALLAMTAAGVDALSGGRAHLGLGASGPQVVEGMHGVPYRTPVARTRETIEVMRAFWRREQPVTYDGSTLRLPLPGGPGTPMRLLTPPVRPEVPVWVAALGPRNVRMTAQTADGWLPMFFAPEWSDRVFGEALKAGTAARDPGRAPLMISAGGLLAVGPDAARHRDRARRQLAFFIGGMGSPGRNFYYDLISRYGFPREAETIQSLFLRGDRKAAAAAVPDALLEATTLCGPKSYVKDRVAAYREAGVTHLEVTPVTDEGQTETDLISQLKELTT
ncbi:LLM class F420-dependent oxidoreductase [Streptomyces sp. WI04-05B]|uniref:LLM class F420-dependent oxidoreductase n=1 Tax=Streptomyces TaxID=1883 RepID=UPI0029B89FD7|nr:MULTISPECIES: LLM class F420-dependent oxidoreductase [unclassified Streptomyces]MDX2547316.1 LLM class F420-dependent oxidoreductase [Streptomyces sp. WI04-05B]MDX2589804.1 LLM class F420-dependent oxidoreductase [Streptomyces sp. WI04-05A]